jgi:hypothetical protein
MLATGMFEYSFGDSERLMLLLVLITLPHAALSPSPSSPVALPPENGVKCRTDLLTCLPIVFGHRFPPPSPVDMTDEARLRLPRGRVCFAGFNGTAVREAASESGAAAG